MRVARIRKGLTVLHRWLGVGFASLFALWFASGFVMMYCPYPRVDAADRLARADVLDATRIRIAPEQAAAKVGSAQPLNRVLLTMIDGRPAYRFFAGGRQTIVFAETGEVLTDVPEEMARRIAAAWVRQPTRAVRFEGIITEADQWTVNGIMRTHGSLLKHAWPDGQETYVSPISAEVVQHTTRGSRIGAYFGAIPHWLYLAPLRRHRELWGQLVVWSSGLATFVALLGLIVGIWRYRPFKRYRTGDGLTSFPYTGQKRWHAVLGMIFGLFTCTWAFSGMMSMDPFPGLEQPGPASRRISETLRSPTLRMADFNSKHPVVTLAEASSSVKELEFVSIAGEPTYLATESPAQINQIPVRGAPSRSLHALLADASRPYRIIESRQVKDYEAYYVDRHQRLPLPVLFISLNDPKNSSYYIDPRTARIVQSYTTSSRWNRWLYQGLHSIDLPWLYRHRPAWDFVVLTLLAGGSAICFTSLVIGWRVLKGLLH